MEQTAAYLHYVETHRWCRSDIQHPVRHFSNEQLFFAELFHAYPVQDYEPGQDYAALCYALRSLSEQQRLVVTAFYGLLGNAKLKRAGICRKYGLSMRDVKAALKRGCHKLRHVERAKKQLFLIFADERTRWRLESEIYDAEGCYGWLRQVKVAS